MSDRRARRKSAIANDERILDAAVVVANEVGLDRLTVSAVAKAAGFTSGAVYARYGDREELLVALWEQRAAASLELLIRQVGSLRRRGASPGYRAAIIEWIAAPPPELRLAIETCLIAHRVDELYDIVPRAVSEWLSDLGLHHSNLSPDESVDLALVACIIGYVMLHHFTEPLAIDLDAAMRWTSLPAQAPIGDPLPPAPTAQELVMEPDDPVHNDLLLAAQAVIARSGVHRTTLARIGRLARLAPATVYGRYKSRDELIADILRRAQKSNSQVGHRLDYMLGDAAMAAALHAFLQPEALVRRRLHNETAVAAWHQPAIAEVYSAAEWKAMQDVADAFPAGLLSREHLIALQQMSLMAIHGSSVLSEVLPSVADLDWRSSAALLLNAVLTDS
jgi:AcrR family transcriptional regulator